MTRMFLTVALLLCTGLVGDAAAGEGPKKLSKKVNKLNAYLEKVGFNNPKIMALTGAVQGRMEGDYLRLGEEQYDVGRVVLLYEIEPRITSKQLQLRFQPNDSKVEYVATPRSIMAHYRWEF